MIEEQPVIFLHIPKTAGTTLSHIIERQYSSEHIVSFGSDTHKSIQKFKSLSRKRRARIRMLKGHMGFGLHKYFPNNANRSPAVYFTLMRNPVERVISHYHHVLQYPTHYLYTYTNNGLLDLDSFLKTKIPLMLDNGQTRLISGVWENVPFGACDADILAIAKKNLHEHFALLGLTERFDETLCLLRIVLGWSHDIAYVRTNVATQRPRPEEVSAETRATIIECNQLDIALYKYATQLFEDKVQQYGSVLTDQVNALTSRSRIEALQNYADIMTRDYRVTSNIPAIGGLLVWLRKNLTSHLREPYLDPILERQVEFNRQLLQEMQAMVENQNHLLDCINELKKHIHTEE